MWKTLVITFAQVFTCETKIQTLHIHQTYLNLFMFGIHKWAQLGIEKNTISQGKVQNGTTVRTRESKRTSMQTSGRSLAITCIRSSKGSNVRLSEGVYGPQATKIFTGSANTHDKIVHLIEMIKNEHHQSHKLIKV